MNFTKFIAGVLRSFNRLYEHSKVVNHRSRSQRLTHRRSSDGKKVRKGYNDAVRYVTSALRIKREVSQDHLRARAYKRAFKGVTGRLSWKDFDRMSLNNA